MLLIRVRVMTTYLNIAKISNKTQYCY